MCWPFYQTASTTVCRGNAHLVHSIPWCACRQTQEIPSELFLNSHLLTKERQRGRGREREREGSKRNEEDSPRVRVAFLQLEQGCWSSVQLSSPSSGWERVELFHLAPRHRMGPFLGCSPSGLVSVLIRPGLFEVLYPKLCIVIHIFFFFFHTSKKKEKVLASIFFRDTMSFVIIFVWCLHAMVGFS